MIEKYKVKPNEQGLFFPVIDLESDSQLAEFGSSQRARHLCTKLNRLAALEAVCREIVETEKGCGDEELKSLIKFWKQKNKTAIQLGLFLETEYCLEELEQQRVIVQKLKAVLEEK